MGYFIRQYLPAFWFFSQAVYTRTYVRSLRRNCLSWTNLNERYIISVFRTIYVSTFFEIRSLGLVLVTNSSVFIANCPLQTIFHREVGFNCVTARDPVSLSASETNSCEVTGWSYGPTKVKTKPSAVRCAADYVGGRQWSSELLKWLWKSGDRKNQEVAEFERAHAQQLTNMSSGQQATELAEGAPSRTNDAPADVVTRSAYSGLRHAPIADPTALVSTRATVAPPMVSKLGSSSDKGIPTGSLKLGLLVELLAAISQRVE